MSATDSNDPDRGPSSSYAQILKSSALIGGAQVLVICVGMARSKAMALMLGPAGFGLTGIYSSIVDLATSASALDIGTAACDRMLLLQKT